MKEGGSGIERERMKKKVRKDEEVKEIVRDENERERKE